MQLDRHIEWDFRSGFQLHRSWVRVEDLFKRSAPSSQGEECEFKGDLILAGLMMPAQWKSRDAECDVAWRASQMTAKEPHEL